MNGNANVETPPCPAFRCLIVASAIAGLCAACAYAVLALAASPFHSYRQLDETFWLAGLFAAGVFLLCSFPIAVIEYLVVLAVRNVVRQWGIRADAPSPAAAASVHAAFASMMLFAGLQASAVYFIVFRYHYKPIMVAGISIACLAAGLAGILAFGLARRALAGMLSGLPSDTRLGRLLTLPLPALRLWTVLLCLTGAALGLRFGSLYNVLPPQMLAGLVAFLAFQTYFLFVLGRGRRILRRVASLGPWTLLPVYVGAAVVFVACWNSSPEVRFAVRNRFGPGYLLVRAASRLTDKDRDNFSWLLAPRDDDDRNGEINPCAWFVPGNGPDVDAAFPGPSRSGLGHAGASSLNVFLFSIDSLVYNYFDRPAAPGSTTPNLAALAREGAYFTRAYTAYPATCGGLRNILGGQFFYPDDPRFNDAFIDKNIAATLRDNGYRTAAFVAHGVVGSIVKQVKGFESVSVFTEGDNYLDNIAHLDRQVSRGAVEYMNFAPRDKPLFMFCSFEDPHWPWNPDEPFRSRFGDKNPWNLREGEIASTDHEIGVILAAIKQLGMWDDSIVVITGDHGEHDALEEINLHVVLIMRFPARKGIVSAAPVSTVDIVPTLYDALGVDPGYPLPGESLLPLLGERQRQRDAGGDRGVLSLWTGHRFSFTKGGYRLRYDAMSGYGEILRIMPGGVAEEAAAGENVLRDGLMKELKDALRGRANPNRYARPAGAGG